MASYGTSDAEYAITQLAQTTMRSYLGQMTLDQCFKERETLNSQIVKAVDEAASNWGIMCLRYEIREIVAPKSIREAMDSVAEADRWKRSKVLQSEAEQQSQINLAIGQKRSVELASEAQYTEKVNLARGEAEGLLAVAETLTKPGGKEAMSLRVAEQYIAAFAKLAKENNTLILPANTGDVRA
eukprot:JP446850.1.p2 GENE.JP446850.1~~JP446850.1.p2  ORF type:complete len:199 (-),score=55.41 JP446850.1:219-770(-)